MRVFSTGSRRDEDSGKPQVWRLMWDAFFALGVVHEYGDGNYGNGNWRYGQPATEVFASAQRHLVAWFTGENLDGKSQLHHLLHAGWNVLYLIHMFVVNREEYLECDDRKYYGKEDSIGNS